jgi:hypothetical protein
MLIELYGRRWQLITETRAALPAGTTPGFNIQSSEPIILNRAVLGLFTNAVVATRLLFLNVTLGGGLSLSLPARTGLAAGSACVYQWVEHANYGSPDPASEICQLDKSIFENVLQLSFSANNFQAGDQVTLAVMSYWQRLAT